MLKKRHAALAATALGWLTATATAFADSDGSNRADGHAPIGVMGDHTHEAGEFMFSYRFMTMQMNGSRDGTDQLSVADVFAQNPTFVATPTDMTMNMHMLGAMYAPTDWLTFMAMGSYVTKTMDHVTRMGGAFTTESEGFGDTRISGLIGLIDTPAHKMHLNAGISVPTGSIDEEDATPMGVVVLPYPMQIGSGTVDFVPGLTYRGRSGALTWGAQYLGTFRSGDNDAGYTLGDRHDVTAWLAYGWSDWVSSSVRVIGVSQGAIDGADPRIQGGAPPFGVQTADPLNQGGDQIDIGLGLNFAVPHGTFAGQRLAIEGSVPVFRDLNGPQLETDWMLTVGWQASF